MSESTVVSDPVTLLSDDASVPGAHLKELSATKKFELDARSTRSLRELQATSIRNSDLPSTSQGNTEISFPSRDTYDDPRITQNPWVRNDPDQRS